MKNKKNHVYRRLFEIALFLLGIFIVALAYNTFVIPNDIVIGGTTGIAIIFNKLFGWNIKLFVLISGLVLLLISLIFIGYKKTRRTAIGTILYPLMLSITLPLAEIIAPYFKFDDFIVLIILSGTFLGLGFGLIYKAGFTTGGIDVIMQLLNKYMKIPEGKASKIANMVVVLAALPIIGLTSVVYSAITLLYEELVTSKITIGISDSKVFFVYTRRIEDVRDALVRNGRIGFTIIPTIGGYSHYRGEMLMCVIKTNDYYRFREIVLDIDPNAFFVINDVYEVNGGYKRQHLPFL
ncbi:MAG: YitT family protein [Bacilli bacterium]|nr:YitT family protein [Bacilli bacterium]